LTDDTKVKSILRRYNRALENLVEARLAFDQLNSSAPQDSVDIWNASIIEAENDRSTNPSAMDIMHSQIKTRQTLKEIRAAIMTEDRISISTAPDDGGTTDWLVEGLDIEDEMWVV